MKLATISFLVLILAIILVLWIIIRKAPLLAMVQLDTIPSERHGTVKKRIVGIRLDRLLKDIGYRIKNFFSPFFVLFRHFFNKIYQRLQQLDRSIRSEELISNPQKIAAELALANDFYAKKQYVPAEKKYIEIISIDRKNVEAYKGLAYLYLETRELNGARELFEHLTRISPNDLEAYLGLGKAFQALGLPEKAFLAYERALEFSPNNPKILDSFIDMSILLKRREAAEMALKKLQEVNPGNEKLKEFFEHLRGA